LSVGSASSYIYTVRDESKSTQHAGHLSFEGHKKPR
jgi:hypothetical protein